MFFDPLAEDADGFAIIAEVGGTPAVPDDVVGIHRVRVVVSFGLLVVFECVLAGLGRIEWRACDGDSLSAFGDVRQEF